MPERDWLLRLDDILECISKIDTYVANQTLEEFARNRMAVDAVLRNLGIIGEAAARIPPSQRSQLSGMPWQKIQGMRNRLIHDYPNVDVRIVWQTTKDDLPRLAEAARQALLAHRSRGD